MGWGSDEEGLLGFEVEVVGDDTPRTWDSGFGVLLFRAIVLNVETRDSFETDG